MTVDIYQDIEDFQRKFKLKQRHIGQRPSKKLIAFRLKFLLEELDELSRACQQDDLPEILDALVDLVYVAVGTAWLLNLPFEEAWERVQAANMTKVRATDPSASKRGSDLDVVKPKDFVPPDIVSLFSEEDLKLYKEPRKNESQLDLIDYLKTLEEK